MLTLVPPNIASRYRDVCLRGWRVTRLEEHPLRYVRLDAPTSWELGSENLGLFVGGCRPLGDTLECLQAVEQAAETPSWVVVAATKKMAAVITQRWLLRREVARVAVSALKLPRVHANIVLATPESLRHIDTAMRQRISGIILIDMLCNVHGARGMTNGGFVVRNDRPQAIADFRNDLRQDRWCPPLILVTQRPARSIGTSAVAQAYCLDGWWFIDGQTLRCNPIQVMDEEMTDMTFCAQAQR